MIDNVQDLDHMLLFAFWIGRDTADILEIHAPLHPWFREFSRFVEESRSRKMMDILNNVRNNVWQP